MVDSDFFTNLQNFGLATMAAGQQPGISALGALGQGGLGMNAAAQQRAQTQLLHQQAQHTGLENMLVPYQMALMQAQAKLYGAAAGDNDSGGSDKPSVATGQTWSSSPGVGPAPANNPGNLRPVGKSTGFMQFSTPQAGMDAMKSDLLAKINGSKSMNGKQPTLRNIISTYAPPSENDTTSYIENVSKDSGLDPDKPLTSGDVDKIIPLMIKQEGNGSSLQQRRADINQPVVIPQPTNRQRARAFLGDKLAPEEYKATVAGPVAAAEAQAKLPYAGPAKQSEKEGEDTAEIKKTYQVAIAQMPRALERLNQLRENAQIASHGEGLLENPDGTPGWRTRYINQFGDPKVASANQSFEQISSQGILPEIGPIIAATGSRGNQFVEKMGAKASGIGLEKHPAAKMVGIQNVEDQYIGNVKALAAELRARGEDVPSDDDIDKIAKTMKYNHYKTPDEVKKAFKNKILTEKEATEILQNQHGMK